MLPLGVCVAEMEELGVLEGVSDDVGVTVAEMEADAEEVAV
jgi:hypothetical protein